MSVSRDDLERHLEKLIRRADDPRAGLYGPGSKLWEINREASIFLGAGRAALLQTAHPYVAHGVDQHSQTKSDPQGRFRRTFANIFAMVFGDLDSAVKSARRVHAIHQRITGQITERVGAFDEGHCYEANNEEALLWVHATLWDTSIHVYELLFRKLEAEEKERYYEETKLFAYLFGISDDVLPPTWNDFVEYNHRMWESDVLAVGRPAAELYKFLLAPPAPALKPVMEWYRILTAGLLPERIRHEYQMNYGRLEERIFESSIRAMRLALKAVPPRTRRFPAYSDAQRRLAGKEGRDRLGQFMDRVVLTGLRGGITGRSKAAKAA